MKAVFVTLLLVASACAQRCYWDEQGRELCEPSIRRHPGNFNWNCPVWNPNCDLAMKSARGVPVVNEAPGHFDRSICNYEPRLCFGDDEEASRFKSGFCVWSNVYGRYICP